MGEGKWYTSMEVMHQQLLAVGRKYHFDEPHAQQVTRLALRLFDQLESVHGLGDEARRVLEAAGWLHDIGQYVAYRGHHKHSYYLIMHTELLGMSEEERAMVAAVARYHRKSGPRAGHEAWKVLGKRERAWVKKLAALLRIADVLDRNHDASVRDVRARVAQGWVEVEIESGGTLGLQENVWARKTALFREVFGYEVHICDNHRETVRGAV